MKPAAERREEILRKVRRVISVLIYLLPLPGLIFLNFGTFLSKFLLSVPGTDALAAAFFSGCFVFLVMSNCFSRLCSYYNSACNFVMPPLFSSVKSNPQKPDEKKDGRYEVSQISCRQLQC